MATGMNMEKLKSNNKIAILSYLNKNKISSRKQIAAGLKLTTATITILTNELIEQGFIKELGTLTEGKVGRKQILIDINSNSKFCIGIEISRNNIYYNLINLKAEIIESHIWKYKEPLSEEVIFKILEDIKKKTLNFNHLILGIGISVYGGLDNDGNWRETIPEIRNIIQNSFNLPVFIQNNIRTLALAEQYLNKAEKDFWLVKYGPGVGAAIILNKKLVEGNKNMAGDIGHIIFEKHNNLCKRCGQVGCLESEVNFEKTINSFDSKLKKLNPILKDEKTFEYILRLSKLDNNFNLEYNLQKLGQAIVIGAGFLDSSKIILAGDIFKEKEFFNFIQAYIVKNSLNLTTEDITYMEDYSEKRKKSPGILVLRNFYNLELSESISNLY